MSKQIYIDSNGNEVLISGTINSADMMPMSANDSTKVSEAIGDLSQLTTSDKSSLVGAVNEVDKAETLYSKNTFNNDIGTALALTGFDLRNYKFISITGYISNISSSSRFTILICNNKTALSANYYPICVNEALGYARLESTNASLKLLGLKINGSAPTGGATITEVIGLVG